MANTALAGKTVVITGATSGIGKETARGLAAMGATVVMACRNPAKARVVRDAMIRVTDNASVLAKDLDLASLASIRAFATELRAAYPSLDVLINNAGVFSTSREETSDGFELTMGTNHLGPFLLTHLLLPSLKNAPAARIVNVASEAAFYGKIDLDDLQMTRSYGMAGFSAYAASKLANVLFTQELGERLVDTPITVNAVHPGEVNTNIWPDHNRFWRFLNRVQKPFRRSAKTAARDVIDAATAPGLKRVTGSFLSNGQVKAVRGACLDVQLQKGLWAESQRLTGLAKSP